jgi:hypothetical protein
VSDLLGNDELREFIILMHESNNAWATLPQEERGRLLEQYGSWVSDLRQSGALVTGRPCGGEYRLLYGSPSGDVTDVTITPDGLSDVLTGFFVIRARDMDSAVEIAKSCPALLHGETIVVREATHS